MHGSVRRAFAALLAVFAVPLGGCQVMVDGAGGVSPADSDRAARRAEQRTAVDEAVRALATQAAVAYRISAKDAGGNPVDLTLNVTRNGTVSGIFPAGGQQVRALRADGTLYLTAPGPYWLAQRVESGKAMEYATRWVRADPDRLPLDPGTVFTPAAAADALRTAVSTLDESAEPMRRTLPDGTEVFDLNAGTGRMQVTTARPHRVVSAEPTLFGGVVGQTFGAGGAIRPEGLSGDGLAAFGGQVRSGVGTLGQPLAITPPVTTAVTDKRLECASSGSCTETVQVGNTVAGPAAAGGSVRVVLRSLVTAEGLGEEHCDQEAVAAPNTVIPLSCTVRFKVPRTSGSAQVVALPQVSGDMLAPVDVAGLGQKVRTEFDALGR